MATGMVIQWTKPASASNRGHHIFVFVSVSRRHKKSHTSLHTAHSGLSSAGKATEAAEQLDKVAQTRHKWYFKKSKIDWFVIMPATVWQILNIKLIQWPETEISQNRQKWDFKNSWNWLVCGYACNSLTNFEYKAHTTTGNGDSTKPTKMRF